MRLCSKYSFFTVVVVCILISIGCNEKVSSPVIARVGKAVITVDDLNNSIPHEYSNQITREQNINYVKHWINTELLYREALRQKFDKDKSIKERLEKMKKDLLSAEVISRYSLQNQASAVNADAVKNYYNQHKNELIREKDMVKYLEIVVDAPDIARVIRKGATPDNFSDFAAQYSILPYSDSVSVPFVPIEELQPEVHQAIISSPAAGIIGPIKTNLGYHILLVLEKLNKGGICTEEESWEEIITLLSTDMQKESMEKLLSDLHLKTDVEFNSELITGNDSDSLSSVGSAN